MQRLFAILERVAASEIDVLINGESGTGKELVATELIQRWVPRGRAGRGRRTAARSRRRSWRASCSGMCGAPLRARNANVKARSRRPMAGPCSSTRSVSCRSSAALLLRALEARTKCGAWVRTARRRGGRAGDRGDEPRPRAGGQPRALPGGPLLPPREADGPRAAAPRSDRRHPAARAVVLRAVSRTRRSTEMERHDWPGNVRELKNYVERSMVLGDVAVFRGEAGRCRKYGVAASGDTAEVSCSKQAKDASIGEFEARCIWCRCSSGPAGLQQGGARGADGPHVLCISSRRSTAWTVHAKSLM